LKRGKPLSIKIGDNGYTLAFVFVILQSRKFNFSILDKKSYDIKRIVRDSEGISLKMRL
jgi:hypothetical protein